MDNYTATIHLLNLKDQNLPVFKQARLDRINSIQKMLKLIRTAERTKPEIPRQLIALDSKDRKSPPLTPSRVGRRHDLPPGPVREVYMPERRPRVRPLRLLLQFQHHWPHSEIQKPQKFLPLHHRLCLRVLLQVRYAITLGNSESLRRRSLYLTSTATLEATNLWSKTNIFSNSMVNTRFFRPWPPI